MIRVPVWEPTKLTQMIGRVRRFCSASQLTDFSLQNPYEKWFVQQYLIFPTSTTVKSCQALRADLLEADDLFYKQFQLIMFKASFTYKSFKERLSPDNANFGMQFEINQAQVTNQKIQEPLNIPIQNYKEKGVLDSEYKIINVKKTDKDEVTITYKNSNEVKITKKEYESMRCNMTYPDFYSKKEGVFRAYEKYFEEFGQMFVNYEQNTFLAVAYSPDGLQNHSNYGNIYFLDFTCGISKSTDSLRITQKDLNKPNTIHNTIIQLTSAFAGSYIEKESNFNSPIYAHKVDKIKRLADYLLSDKYIRDALYEELKLFFRDEEKNKLEQWKTEFDEALDKRKQEKWDYETLSYIFAFRTIQTDDKNKETSIESKGHFIFNTLAEKLFTAIGYGKNPKINGDEDDFYRNIWMTKTVEGQNEDRSKIDKFINSLPNSESENKKTIVLEATPIAFTTWASKGFKVICRNKIVFEDDYVGMSDDYDSTINILNNSQTLTLDEIYEMMKKNKGCSPDSAIDTPINESIDKPIVKSLDEPEGPSRLQQAAGVVVDAAGRAAVAAKPVIIQAAKTAGNVAAATAFGLGRLVTNRVRAFEKPQQQQAQPAPAQQPSPAPAPAPAKPKIEQNKYYKLKGNIVLTSELQADEDEPEKSTFEEGAVFQVKEIKSDKILFCCTDTAEDGEGYLTFEDLNNIEYEEVEKKDFVEFWNSVKPKAADKDIRNFIQGVTGTKGTWRAEMIKPFCNIWNEKASEDFTECGVDTNYKEAKDIIDQIKKRGCRYNGITFEPF